MSAGGFTFVRGMLPGDPTNDKVHLPEAVESQLRQALANLDAVLRTRGLALADVVALTVYVAQLHRFEERLLRVCAESFEPGQRPTCSLIGVERLPREALVSIDAIATALPA